MKVADLFEINYGQNLSLNKLTQVAAGNGVAFVSRTAKNNGVSAWVAPVDDVSPLESGLLTVSLRSRNHALATFVQPRPFYCGYHIYVLTPKAAMTLQEKLWWAQCIEANRFRYNFGRQANRSLGDLELPDAVPSWVREASTPYFTTRARPVVPDTFASDDWQWIRLDKLFEISRGRNILKRDMVRGDVAYVGASAESNGITARIDAVPDYLGGQITVSTNGSVGEAFFQPDPFIASGDVAILQPKFVMEQSHALFICTLLRAEKYRWHFGRKWGVSRIRESMIKLPTLPNDEVDWSWVRTAVESRPLYALLNTQQDD